MGSWFDSFLGRKQNSTDFAVYADAASLFDGLVREKSDAIRCVYARTSGTIARLGKNYGLEDADIEELIGDCIALLLVKIRSGQYVFQGYDPASFAVEIAKNKVRHFKKRVTTDLSELEQVVEEPDYATQESVELLEKLLMQLPENCRNLIRLKYLDEIKDKDIIEQQLTQYRTVDALKNHRAQCMKKLVALAASAK